MVISTQQIDEFVRLQMQQNGQPASQQATGTNSTFDDYLSQALTTQQGGQDAVVMHPGTGQTEMISKMLLGHIGTAEDVDTETDPVLSAYNTASGTLDLWNTYAQKLSSAQGSSTLKDAYSILENIGNQVARLKSNTTTLRSQDPEFNSLVNNLEVLATTERIKFNRGDYV